MTACSSIDGDTAPTYAVPLSSTRTDSRLVLSRCPVPNDPETGVSDFSSASVEAEPCLADRAQLHAVELHDRGPALADDGGLGRAVLALRWTCSRCRAPRPSRGHRRRPPRSLVVTLVFGGGVNRNSEARLGGERHGGEAGLERRRRAALGEDLHPQRHVGLASMAIRTEPTRDRVSLGRRISVVRRPARRPAPCRRRSPPWSGRWRPAPGSPPVAASRPASPCFGCAAAARSRRRAGST